MAQPHPLDLLKEITAELVAQELRSDSAVIARLATLIADALRAGHSHRSIHAAIVASGLAISWINYRIALGRARKAQRDGSPASAAELPSAISSPLPSPRLPATLSVVSTAPAREDLPSFMPQESGEMRTLGGTSSATRVMDALRQAREVANSKDYGQIGRDLYRQQQRERRKDRP